MFVPPQIPETPFTWTEAKALGFSRHRFDELVDQGLVRKVLRNVYVRATTPDTLLTRAQAAALVVSPFAVVCDRTAAWLYGVDALRFHELDVLPPLETFSLRGAARPQRRGVAGGERDLAPHDLQVLDGITLTTPLRTALDLGCRLRRSEALAAMDGLMRTCGVTREDMARELPRYFRRRGVVQLRQLVPVASPLSESTGESWVRMALIDAGLPRPELQVWVHDEDGRQKYRLDLAYPRARVVIEYDGRDFHSTPEQRRLDAERREWLRRRGWTVIVVDKDGFEPDTLASWLRAVRSALRMVA